MLSTSGPPPELRSSLGASLDPMVANPTLERRRYRAVKALRSTLARLTTLHGGRGVKAPQLAFERWLARWALRAGDAAFASPIIPADGLLDEKLIKDLVRTVPSLEVARIIAVALTLAGVAAALKLSSY